MVKDTAQIVTIFDPHGANCLSTKAPLIPLTTQGLEEAKTIAEQLVEALKPLMPAAGLAAPQLGISKQVFIYSWDRSIENIEIVINPSIKSESLEIETSWEACFSTIQPSGISQAAEVSRAKSLFVEYLNLAGEIVQQTLTGFAAKVFQHEYDHLQGIENIKKEGAAVKTFATYEELIQFMQTVKKNDSMKYIKPI